MFNRSIILFIVIGHQKALRRIATPLSFGHTLLHYSFGSICLVLRVFKVHIEVFLGSICLVLRVFKVHIEVFLGSICLVLRVFKVHIEVFLGSICLVLTVIIVLLGWVWFIIYIIVCKIYSFRWLWRCTLTSIAEWYSW